MLENLALLFENPPLYAKTDLPFWEDEHISLQMLHAHLDPNHDGASRNLHFIDQSVEWISSLLPSEKYPSILDVGCGPGLYTERFAKKGYMATGVDFSRRSISYARASAEENRLSIDYFCQNYLKLSLGIEFDFAIMIYYDYGALSAKERSELLNIIYRHLKPGGKFLLDVLPLTQFYAFQEKQTWEACPRGGFWRPEKYLSINRNCKYSKNVTLRQTIIITSEEVCHYNLWDTYFSKRMLEEEASNHRFKICQYFSDVAGQPYHKNSPTLAVLLEK